ncbi:hypothetical protein [Streptosporangium canum]|uniref:hypothetical protein n=1 Tax=Streptosporangium canum TaxID=324952 RepID=UPI00378FECD3
MGDDRTRFADARALKVYAGAAPITRAGGGSRTVVHRRVTNQRLAAVGYVWAFAFRRALNYPERTKADLLIRRFWVRDPGSPSDVADRPHKGQEVLRRQGRSTGYERRVCRFPSL